VFTLTLRSVESNAELTAQRNSSRLISTSSLALKPDLGGSSTLSNACKEERLHLHFSQTANLPRGPAGLVWSREVEFDAAWATAKRNIKPFYRHFFLPALSAWRSQEMPATTARHMPPRVAH